MQSKAINYTFLLMKQSTDSILHGFTGFNISISSALPKSNLHYLPIIEASPTDMATVGHILKEAVKMAETLLCPTVLVVFDQAIYSKAQMIRWTDQSLQDTLLPRLGEFHTLMCFLSAVGKRFECSGFEDILVESQTIAAGSMSGVISGHQYNRSIRAHKLLFEALGRLQVKEFIDSSPEE